MKVLSTSPDIPKEEQTTAVKALLDFLEQFSVHIVFLEKTVVELKDEISILKGEKKRPTSKPSDLDKTQIRNLVAARAKKSCKPIKTI